MRLILIDNGSGCISGDTADYLADSDEWSDVADERDAVRLSLLAARLLDQSIGGVSQAYSFLGHDPRDTSMGYHVYQADVAAEAVPVVWDGQDQAIIDAVSENCSYIGFVRCDAG